jgi:hypothetical protein
MEVTMQTLVQGGIYQVLEVLEQQEGYRAYLCINVETNNNYKPLILNTYENCENIRRYLPSFYDLKHEHSTDFVELLSGEHSITAVFQYHEGKKLKDFSRQLNKEDFEIRCKYACLLLEACLLLDAMVDFIAYSCLEPENIIIMDKIEKVGINYIIRPVDILEKPFKWKKIANLMEIIFIKNRFVPDELWDYIDELKQNKDESIVSAFSHWKQIYPTLLEEHKRLKKESMQAYIIRWLKSFIQKRVKRYYPKSPMLYDSNKK